MEDKLRAKYSAEWDYDPSNVHVKRIGSTMDMRVMYCVFVARDRDILKSLDIIVDSGGNISEIEQVSIGRFKEKTK